MRTFHSLVGVESSEPLPGCSFSVPPLLLPLVGDFVLMIITSIVSPQRFYAQMPIGRNTLTVEVDKDGKDNNHIVCINVNTDALIPSNNDSTIYIFIYQT